ncbi:3D domain-containing protein [Thermoclostridium caenicola]|uniref:Uncharacterized conserved protein YabE, contains G5 and tandem DUF348 domains n=1 Tax=Thermoclostridium caenicola TaxID=659425 RepID=A0A1M6C3E7_9FIRM|nr:3D domain-containing protein [Thermoclostridium caenicola]SHI55294.1 Uncharacterized conserved protein YabE, contains G5 and tandem DUF348 domains [Thermoclostridium caenicola]HOP73212.1 3D domain-containing protein [Thermoclostridium caenicola]
MSGLYLQYVRRTLPLKQIALLLLAAAVAVAAGIVLYSSLSKEVTIIDNGRKISVRTMGADVGQALDQVGITVEQHDYISVAMDTPLRLDAPNEVTIKRAVPVNLTVDGQTTTVMSYRDTVEELLRDNGIIMGPLDRYAGVSPTDPLTEGMEIRVIRVEEKIVTEEEQIPYHVLERPNKTMNEGETRTVNEGENGIREKQYKITYEDGKPVNREFIGETVVKEPVSRIVEYGTVPNFVTSRGERVRYSKVLKMKATAYTNSFEDTGKNPGDPGYGITYTGMTARTGVVAVDPKVIPLGSKLYIEVPGSAPDYGFAIAADIGSAIKGNKIDLFFNTTEEVRRWGVRNVVVYILNEQDDDRWKQNYNPCK